MMAAIRQSERWKGLLASLALLVLAVQLVAPSGFMPLRTEGGVIVTLCTGQGAVNILVDSDQAPRKKHGGSEEGAVAQQPCAFGALLQLTVPPVSASELALPAWQLASGQIASALKSGLIARLAAPPPPSSGPPSHF